MDFSILINWMSPLSFLGTYGLSFSFVFVVPMKSKQNSPKSKSKYEFNVITHLYSGFLNEFMHYNKLYLNNCTHYILNAYKFIFMHKNKLVSI